ncbi:hypothetical protein JCM8097_006845 [Rhodosporidiobolus ruineniae]
MAPQGPPPVYHHPAPPPGRVTIHGVGDAAAFLQECVEETQAKPQFQRNGHLVFTGAAALWAWIYIVLPDGTELDHWERHATFEDVATLAGRLHINPLGVMSPFSTSSVDALWVDSHDGTPFLKALMHATMEEAGETFDPQPAPASRHEWPNGVGFLMRASRQYLGFSTPTHDQHIVYDVRVDLAPGFHDSAAVEHKFSMLNDADTVIGVKVAKFPYLFCEALADLAEVVDVHQRQQARPQIFRNQPPGESLMLVGSAVVYLYIVYIVAKTKGGNTFSEPELRSTLPLPPRPQFTAAIQWMSRCSSDAVQLLGQTATAYLAVSNKRQQLFRPPRGQRSPESWPVRFGRCFEDVQKFANMVARYYAVFASAPPHHVPL